MTTIDLHDNQPPTDAAGRRLDGSFTVPSSVLIQIVLWLVAALMTYSAVNARVAVVESKVNGVEQRLDRIEYKLDKALEHDAAQERGR